MEGFVDAIGLDRYAIYTFDYAAPTGLRLALAQVGAEAYRRDLPASEGHFFDTGHFALNTTVPRSPD